MNALGLSPVVAIGVGVRRHRPAARAAWILLAAGCAAFWLGDLYTYNYERFTRHEVPFPSLGDAAYVAMYPLMMGGLLLLVRRRSNGSDRGGLIDGLVLTIGPGAAVVGGADRPVPGPGRRRAVGQDDVDRLPHGRRDPAWAPPSGSRSTRAAASPPSGR